MQLKHIAHVISGYTFRGAITPEPQGKTFVLQAKNIVEGKPLDDVTSLTAINHDISIKPAANLQKNDVLLIARGMKSGSFRSTVFTAKASNVIVSSSVHIIRIKSQQVLPQYLSRYLSSKRGQESVSQIVSGSYIGSISRKKLEEIEIPTPSVLKQKLLIDLYENLEKQNEIVCKQNSIKNAIADATFLNIINT